MQEEKRRRETGCKKELTYTIECAKKEWILQSWEKLSCM